MKTLQEMKNRFENSEGVIYLGEEDFNDYVELLFDPDKLGSMSIYMGWCAYYGCSDPREKMKNEGRAVWRGREVLTE